MKDLIVVCAGGFAIEAVITAHARNLKNPEWNILGFLDDTKEVGEEIYMGYKVIGGIKDWQPKPNEYFAMGHSDPHAKEKLYNLLKSKGAQFATLISPEVGIPRGTEIGEGCIITMGWFGGGVKLGKCVNVAGSLLGGCTVGDFTTTTGFANIAGAAIGKRVFIGTHAAVLNGRKVGDDAFICAGSICFNHIKPGTKVMGNPAKKVDF